MTYEDEEESKAGFRGKLKGVQGWQGGEEGASRGGGGFCVLPGPNLEIGLGPPSADFESTGSSQKARKFLLIQ